LENSQVPYELLKRKLLDLFRYNVQPRVEALHAEQIFQGIFERQCRQLGLTKVFFPVGAAASYSLMYLLTRALTELSPKRIVELGSGETTVLIDRLLPANGVHLGYEQSDFWARTVAKRAPRCSVQHCAVVPKTFEGVSYEGFDGMQPADFDLLLVDGPNGTDHLSRYDCVALVASNRAQDFLIIVDDADRPGEQETIAALTLLLARKSIDHKLNYLAGRTTQAVIATSRFRAASYFY
jgi:hypothetical protein